MNINFFRIYKPCLVLSSILIITTVVLFFSKGFKLGTEFTGGIEIRVEFNQQQTITGITQSMNQDNDLTVSVESIQSTPNTFIIRNKLINGDATETERLINEKLQEIYPEGYEVNQSVLIGGTISQENTANAVILSLVVIACIIGYLAMRFKLFYGIAAILAVIHDVSIMLLVILAFDLEMNVLVIVALLTIFGYSVNDTIIFFDRVRDSLKHFHSEDYKRLLNESMNAIFVRTLFTSLTTLIVTIALFISTEGGYREFALMLSIGIFSGSYSSIYIASPFMLYWHHSIKKQI